MRTQITKCKHEIIAQIFLQNNSHLAAKYFSPTLLESLVSAMQRNVVPVRVAFDQLANGTLKRTDGKVDEPSVESVEPPAEPPVETVKKVVAPPVTRRSSEVSKPSGHGSARFIAAAVAAERRSAEIRSAELRSEAIRIEAIRAEAIRVAEIKAIQDAAEDRAVAEFGNLSDDVVRVFSQNPAWRAATYQLIKSGKL